MKKVVDLFKTHWTYPVGAIVGAIGGYVYYSQVGCVTGTCPLQSSPTVMMIYGAVVGMLVFSFFKKK